MLKTITLDLGETNELDQFLDEYVLDEMRGAINDLDLSESTIAHMQKLLDKTKRHFRSQIVKTENTDVEQWNVIKKRPMTNDERREWSERFGYDIEDEDAFI